MTDIFEPHAFSQLEAEDNPAPPLLAVWLSWVRVVLVSAQMFLELPFRSWQHWSHPPTTVKVIGPLEAKRCSHLKAETKITTELLYF